MAVKTAPHSPAHMPITSGQGAARGSGVAGSGSQTEALIHHLIG